MRNGVIFHPALDISKFSDDDLNEKINDITRRLVMAGRMYNHEAITQLNNLQNILINERYERIEKELNGSAETGRAVIVETEPDMRLPDPKRDTPVKRDEGKKRQYVPIILKNWKDPQRNSGDR